MFHEPDMLRARYVTEGEIVQQCAMSGCAIGGVLVEALASQDNLSFF